jgi:hypothetical protein
MPPIVVVVWSLVGCTVAAWYLEVYPQHVDQDMDGGGCRSVCLMTGLHIELASSTMITVQIDGVGVLYYVFVLIRYLNRRLNFLGYFL